MSDDAYVCFKCKKEFKTEKERKDHQHRKRGGKLHGCFVGGKALPSQEPVPSDASSTTSSIAWSDITSDFDVDDHDFPLSESDNTNNRDREEYKMGYNSENFEPIDDTIDSLLRTVKLANNRVLNGRHSPHPDGEGVSVNIASIPFVHGLVNTGVSAVLKHKDFDRKEEKSTTATIYAARVYRDGLLEKLAVKDDQSNALQSHLCEASLCNSTCTYLKRRILFHKQQALLAIKFVESKRVGIKPWIKFAKGHLRRLRVEDRNGFSSFIQYAQKTLSSSGVSGHISQMLGEFQGSMDLPMEALEQAPRPHHSHPSSSLEVPVASLEKGQARLSNREQRRKAGK